MEKLCKCGKNPASEPHPCPYQIDINDNYESTCTCCAECEQNCADDI